jgi:hypothetical protein
MNLGSIYGEEGVQKAVRLCLDWEKSAGNFNKK